MKKLASVVLSLAFIMMSCGVSFAECKDSKKYHTADCGIVKNIKAENQICFKAQEEAIKAGYAPCGICKPPKPKDK